jgi:hypothetical protein
MTIRGEDNQIPTPPIWVDFMARDERARVPLDYPGTVADLTRHQVVLRDGMSITLYTHDTTEAADPDDLIAIATVQRDEAAGRWFAVFDWESLMHLSDLDDLDRGLYRAAKQ